LPPKKITPQYTTHGYVRGGHHFPGSLLDGEEKYGWIENGMMEIRSQGNDDDRREQV
jgi:hypothetical protein